MDNMQKTDANNIMKGKKTSVAWDRSINFCKERIDGDAFPTGFDFIPVDNAVFL
jgi:hypothetical protein